MSKTKVLHKYLREPNHLSTKHSRIENRANPFENTLTRLHDPKNDRYLTIIGTTNSSTLLANRTKQYVSETKPDALYIQTTKDWWTLTKDLDITTHSEFNKISDYLPKTSYYVPNNPRGLLSKIRFNLWMFTVNMMMNLPDDFRPFTPGLEMKYAIQEAEKAGAEIYYAGTELNKSTIEGLNSQYLNFTTPLIKLFKRYQYATAFSNNTLDMEDFWHILRVRGGEAFAESIDRRRVNMMVHILNQWVPRQKDILINVKDESIFLDLYKMRSKNIVAVINQWHVTGVQHRWKTATGIRQPVELTNPVADMDMDAMNQIQLVNNYLFERAQKVGNTERGTDNAYQVQYHKELWEPERTRHTHHHSYKDIPGPNQQGEQGQHDKKHRHDGR